MQVLGHRQSVSLNRRTVACSDTISSWKGYASSFTDQNVRLMGSSPASAGAAWTLRNSIRCRIARAERTCTEGRAP